jgi:lysophospholipase L1-like esterase
MKYLALAAGLCLTVLASSCGSSAPPTGPGPITTPPPDPGPPPSPPAPPPTLGVTKILAFGDSMTAGTTSLTFVPFTLTPGISASYPFKLQALISARYTTTTVEVYNGGRAGEKTTEGRDRLGGVMSEAKAPLLLLMEGANDLNDPVLSTSVSSITGRMEDMVRNAQGRGMTVMLATIPPQRTGSGKAAAPGLVDKYNNELRQMAAKKGAILVDVNAQFPVSLIGQDSLHPTEEGYQKIAEIFLDAIKAKYEIPASTVSAARR